MITRSHSDARTFAFVAILWFVCTCCARAATDSPQAVTYLYVPPGYHVRYISKHVPGARYMAFAPNGDLLVAEPQLGNVALIKPHASPDARPELFDVGLPLPNGMAFLDAKLYVATWFGVVRYDYPDQHSQKLFDNMPRGIDHNRRALAIAKDGTIFVSSGSNCNVCDESDERFATILRYAKGDSHGSIYAKGVRNASGLAFDAQGRLWAVVNQRDDIGPTQAVTDNLPPDELNLVAQAGDYGWPQCYAKSAQSPRLPNPEYPHADCANRAPMTFALDPHSAPMAIVFYYATAFPQRDRGSAFIALHGSWNRSSPSGDKVIEVTFTGGKPTGTRDFVTGWLQGDGSYRGRPMGLAIGPDGGLYVSDDKLGNIYEIYYTGKEEEHP